MPGRKVHCSNRSLSMPTTAWPASTSMGTITVPMYPLCPVTRTRIQGFLTCQSMATSMLSKLPTWHMGSFGPEPFAWRSATTRPGVELIPPEEGFTPGRDHSDIHATAQCSEFAHRRLRPGRARHRNSCTDTQILREARRIETGAARGRVSHQYRCWLIGRC